MIGMLDLLGSHAVDQAGAWGDAVAQASLTCWDIDRQTTGVTAELLEVDSLRSWERVDGTRELRQLPTSRHTISLDGLSSGIVDRLIAARLLLTDLVRGFGSPEVFQIDASGALRRHYWGRQYWTGQSMESPLDWLLAKGATAVDSLIDA